MVFAGYAAQSGALSVVPLLLTCWAGSFVGDLIRFWIGRQFGIRWLRFAPRLMRAAERAARLAGRYSVWMILLHRYPYFIRNVAGVAYGMLHLPWRLFLLMNFVAAGLWACIVVLGGYAFGHVLNAFFKDASAGVGALLLLVFLLLIWWFSRRLDRVAGRE